MSDQVTKKYYQTITAIDKEIETLKGQIAKYNQEAGRIDWTHVGDMEHLLSQLKQLNEEE